MSKPSVCKDWIGKWVALWFEDCFSYFLREKGAAESLELLYRSSIQPDCLEHRGSGWVPGATMDLLQPDFLGYRGSCWVPGATMDLLQPDW